MALDEALLHELTHAATAHAIDNNIRGTRDLIRQLMTSLEKQIGVGREPAVGAHALRVP